MSKFIIAILLLILPFSIKAGGVDSSEVVKKDTVLIGAFVTSLYDFNLTDQSYNIIFWLWFNHKNDSLKLLESVEISNAKTFEFKLSDSEKKGKIIWDDHKCYATMKQDWDMRSYPFDVQQLYIELEDALKDTSELIFKADVENSLYDKTMETPGWNIANFHIRDGVKTYQTTYGDPTLKGTSTYAGARITFEMRRVNSLGLFVKLFTGVYVAFFISLLALMIDPVDTDPRFGLSVGGMFAAVGNKYIVDSIIPEGDSYTLIDKVHALTFALILLTILISVISLYYYKRDFITTSKKMDRVAAVVMTSIYIVLNIIFIGGAVR